MGAHFCGSSPVNAPAACAGAGGPSPCCPLAFGGINKANLLICKKGKISDPLQFLTSHNYHRIIFQRTALARLLPCLRPFFNGFLLQDEIQSLTCHSSAFLACPPTSSLGRPCALVNQEMFPKTRACISCLPALATPRMLYLDCR